MAALGYEPIRTLISSTVVHSRQAWRKPSMSKLPSSRRNFTRLIDARLHAVSSRNIYSEHGLLALMRPSAGQVCHSLTVVSYCTPGSAQAHAALAIWSHSDRAFNTRRGFGSRPSRAALSFSVRQNSGQSPSFSTASMNAFGTRTELLLF